MLKPFVPFNKSLMADGMPYRLIAVIAHNSKMEDHFVAYCWAGTGADSTSAESSWVKFDDTGVTRGFDFHSCTHHDSGILFSMRVDNNRERSREVVNSVLAEILVYQRL
jgi:ubiquitin C-terminal hydrolase